MNISTRTTSSWSSSINLSSGHFIFAQVLKKQNRSPFKYLLLFFCPSAHTVLNCAFLRITSFRLSVFGMTKITYILLPLVVNVKRKFGSFCICSGSKKANSLPKWGKSELLSIYGFVLDLKARLHRFLMQPQSVPPAVESLP